MPEIEVVKRSEAREQGWKFYFTGKPCKRGHVSERYVSDKSCVVCTKTNGDEWYQNNKERKAETGSIWYNQNKDRVIKRQNEYRRERYKVDPDYRMLRFMRDSLRRTLSGYLKEDATINLVGYNQQELRKHIEDQFTDDMCWDNYGDLWNIDHTIPIKYFIESGENDPSVVNALSNLKPILVEDNRKKGSKYEPED